jgi:pyridoxal 5'-phosphate synthase pdxT subunit
VDAAPRTADRSVTELSVTGLSNTELSNTELSHTELSHTELSNTTHRPFADQLTVGILALQGDVREHHVAVAELGATPRHVRRPEDLVGVDGIIVPGGESTTMSMLLEWSGLVEPLTAALRAGLPVFGTCAGLILLATDVVDGRSDQIQLGCIDISVRRNGYGRQIRSFECDIDVRGFEGGQLHAVFIRAPVIERMGPEVDVLARLPGAGDTGDVTTGTVLCRQGSVLVAAFHPELTPDRRLHRLFLHQIRHHVDNLEQRER